MEDNNLFAIEVDTENYASTAAGDLPPVPRTFQSEEAFQLQKASYKAKIDNGNKYQELIKTVPALAETPHVVEEKVKLSKKEVQLLGYAVAEMYFDRRYEEILALVRRVEERVEGGKLRESLGRWRGRCEARLERESLRRWKGRCEARLEREREG